MKTVTTLAANELGRFLTKDFRQILGPTHDDVGARLGSLARSTIECLGRSDALYHNFEHTLLVPTVSETSTRGFVSGGSARTVVSSVANSLSATRTLLSVSARISDDFSAFVYPTSATRS